MPPLCLCACLLLDVSAPIAQTLATTGAIDGAVTDATGAVLPQVAIVLSSPALMGRRTTVTGAEGRFRFPAVPPGNYLLVFARPGFVALRREAVHVGVGSTTTVDATLEIAAVNDRVIVERGSSLLDRRSTAITVAFDARQLANLPGSRSLFSILGATPALHVARFEVGGGSGDPGSPYGAFGTTGANRPMIEGLIVSRLFPTGFAPNYGAFQEVSVGVAAHSAEWPLPGVQMQIVTKSGGNRYRGTLYADYENRHWQAFNIDDDQIRRGATGGGGVSPREANRLWSYRDVNADVGGYIRKDAVWWYVSFRDQDVAARHLNFPVKPSRTRLTNCNTKVTFRAGAHHRLVAYGQVGRHRQPNRLDPFGPVGGTLTAATAINDSDGATLDERGWGWVGKGEWTATISDHSLVEVRAGAFGADRRQSPNGSGPRFEDIGTLVVTGGNRRWSEALERPQVLGTFSYFRPGWLGSHAFKLGAEAVQTTKGERLAEGYPGDVLDVLRNGTPIEVYLFQAPAASESGVRAYAAYATDAWRISNRFAFDLGLRFDRYRVFLPAQGHSAGRFNPTQQMFAAVDDVITWNVLAPRVGLIVDVSGDGQTLAKVHYGTYWHAPGTSLGASVNPNPGQWWRRHAWSDPDGNGTWEPGEEGRLLGSRGGAALESLDPDLKPAYMREVVASIERQLPESIGLRASVVWREDRQLFTRQNASWPFGAFTVPVTVRDPGPDGRVGTRDDGAPVQVYDLDPAYRSLDPDNIVRNVRNASSRYWSFDLTATKRFDRGWSLVAGLEHTWSRDHAASYWDSPSAMMPYP